MNKFSKIALAMLAGVAFAAPAHASLTLFQSFTGAVAQTTDGCGSVTQTCNLTANIPVGATVLGVYLYTSNFSRALSGGTLKFNDGLTNPTISYAGGVPLGSTGGGQAFRSDLTSFFAPFLTGSASPLSFTATETHPSQDGEALVIIYSKPLLPTATIFVFDGFSNNAADSFAFSIAPFAGGLAEMRVGIGFSFDGSDPRNPTSNDQVSIIKVNGNTLTSNAGHCDDAKDASCDNGNLITVGGDDDPFSPLNPTVAQDHERYNLGLLLPLGTTSINISTQNPSNDDNIFLATFAFSGTAFIGPGPTVPEPDSIVLLLAGLASFGLLRRRKQK